MPVAGNGRTGLSRSQSLLRQSRPVQYSWHHVCTYAYIATRKWRVLNVTPQVAAPGAESAEVAVSVPGRFTVMWQPWTSCSHTCASAIKQFDLKTISGPWRPMAGKVTVGLASHRPWVIDFSDSAYGLPTWGREMSTHVHSSVDMVHVAFWLQAVNSRPTLWTCIAEGYHLQETGVFLVHENNEIKASRAAWHSSWREPAPQRFISPVGRWEQSQREATSEQLQQHGSTAGADLRHDEDFMPVPYVGLLWLLLCYFMYIFAINIRILKFQRWLLFHV